MLNMRRAQERDLDRLLEIINEPGVIEHMPLERPVKADRVRSWFLSSQEFGYPVIFVLELDEVIGACSLREDGKLTIWISARYQRKGHGAEAIRRLAGHAKQRKMRRLWLECQKDNAQALEFYRKLDFRGIKEDAQNITMELRL